MVGQISQRHSGIFKKGQEFTPYASKPYKNEQKLKKPSIYSIAQIQAFCQDLNTFTMLFSQHSLGLKNILEMKVHINLPN